MRALNRLSATGIKSLGEGKHPDGGGLWLHKRKDGGAQWFLRLTVHGRRREMGLGRLADVSLKEARLAAEKCRALVREGKDPIKERDRQRREGARSDNTLRSVAEDAFEARKAELRGEGKAGRWFSPLELHVLTKLGKVPVEEVNQQDIKETLAPIWHTKADTARKAMNRLNIVFKHAAALGLDVDLQATDKARALLGKSRHQPKNIVAMDWRDVPAFYASLSEPTLTHLALRLLILTGTRSKPIRFLHEDHIDGDVWTVPAELMKGLEGKTGDFRVPLSNEALSIIEQARPHARDGFLFPSSRKGVISDATMARLMERREMAERPHGFRSSLRTWLSEATSAPPEVAETVLAHATGSAVERAYRRTDFLEQRRALMERWAEHVSGSGSGKVVKLA
ncbi:integrase arm-type DNA-binding domain-containing protein [Roseivivax marinus]|uniref:tyrosine-type recombinase/integrase n=1 Tax=Roseivivax marinus TaxID=1379903 RepID=UPI001F03B1E1|nr:site-specific integrase [Roseivivax marinus]UMA64637.1 integrase arm-type DNA-binding domain-containing protein [Roseivivax marinus]